MTLTGSGVEVALLSSRSFVEVSSDSSSSCGRYTDNFRTMNKTFILLTSNEEISYSFNYVFHGDSFICNKCTMIFS